MTVAMFPVARTVAMISIQSSGPMALTISDLDRILRPTNKTAKAVMVVLIDMMIGPRSSERYCGL